MTVSATNQTSVLPNAFAGKDNGDNTLTKPIVGIGLLLDSVGGTRQVGFATAASASFVSSVAAPAISSIATAAASLGLICSGAISMGFTAMLTIPDAKGFLTKAENEKKLAEQEFKDPAATQVSDRRVKSAKQMVTIRKMGLANQSILFGMGVVQSAGGVVYMLGSEAASLFHYSTVLSSSVAALSTVVTSVALGAIYAFRGTMMITKACLALSIVNSFEREFKACKTPEDKIEFLKKEENLGAAYMQPRVDASCLQKKIGDTVYTMTALGYKIGEDSVIYEYHNITQSDYFITQSDYLKAVEKGIFSEQFKQMLYAIIGGTMIIGGALTLAATFLSSGIAPIAISLASAIFFLLAEVIFVSYDSPLLFDKMRDLFNWMRDRIFDSIHERKASSSEDSTFEGSSRWVLFEAPDVGSSLPVGAAVAAENETRPLMVEFPREGLA